MNAESVITVLQWALPSGCVGTVIGWFVSRKGRRLDMLGKMQKSIDDLTAKYTEVLDENVRLKCVNAEQLAKMREMEIKMDVLNAKVDELTEQLKLKNNERNQSNSSGRRAPVRGSRVPRQGGNLPGNNAAGAAVKPSRSAGNVRDRSAGVERISDSVLGDLPAGHADGDSGSAGEDGGTVDEDSRLPRDSVQGTGSMHTRIHTSSAETESIR